MEAFQDPCCKISFYDIDFLPKLGILLLTTTSINLSPTFKCLKITRGRSYLQKDKQKATYSKDQHPGQSVGKLSSQHLSSFSYVRFACPDHHSAWHASGSHLATMQEETCQSAQPKESPVIPRSLASPLGLNHFHKSQDTATAGPSKPPSPQFHAIEANYAWSSIRAPPTNGWKKE